MIVSNFSKAAKSYLPNAQIQKSSAIEICKLVENYYLGNELILDLGSGPGTLQHCTSKQNYHTLAYDLSLEMLKVANCRYKINGDANALPFLDNSFPIVISNLMLQWPDNKQVVLAEAYRVLKPGGTLIITTLIEPSLFELKNSWGMVDSDQHTLKFLAYSEYISLVKNLGLKMKEIKKWNETFYFEDLLSIFNHFKTTGTNLNKTRIGLGGRQKLEQLELLYQKLATPDGLPLSYSYLLFTIVKDNFD